jgi:DNA-binding winged helix-turn-helix (wHTH) protein
MTAQPNLRFDSFVLDRANQQLRGDSEEIPLPPKTFAVLQYLAENPQRLVTQAELLKAVWGPVAVGDGLLRGYVRDIRHALGDAAAHPRLIETIPRRGFRFLAEVTAIQPLTWPCRISPSRRCRLSDWSGAATT